MMVSAGPAFADVFTVGIVVDAATSEPGVATFMEGFQVAVDQSPDVSHPPNVEGGDHLGSMDVVMVVVDAVSEPDELVGAAVELVETNRVPILVVDVPPDVLMSLVGPVTASGTMVIAMSESDGTVSTQTPMIFLAADRDGTEALLTDRTPAFEEVFLAAYGRPSSPAAARGYLAGRLVDMSVEATDRDPSDVETLTIALADATSAPETTAPETSAPQTPAEVDDEGQGSAEPVVPSEEKQVSLSALAAVLGMILAAAVHVYWAAGGTWPGTDRSDLARKVVGNTDEFPSTIMTIGVAALLTAGAVLVGGATGLWALPVSASLVRMASWVVAAVLVARGALGLIVSGWRQATGNGTPFTIRDALVYSPLTLLLGVSTVLALVENT